MHSCACFAHASDASALHQAAYCFSFSCVSGRGANAALSGDYERNAPVHWSKLSAKLCFLLLRGDASSTSSP